MVAACSLNPPTATAVPGGCMVGVDLVAACSLNPGRSPQGGVAGFGFECSTRPRRTSCHPSPQGRVASSGSGPATASTWPAPKSCRPCAGSLALVWSRLRAAARSCVAAVRVWFGALFVVLSVLVMSSWLLAGFWRDWLRFLFGLSWFRVGPGIVFAFGVSAALVLVDSRLRRRARSGVLWLWPGRCLGGCRLWLPSECLVICQLW